VQAGFDRGDPEHEADHRVHRRPPHLEAVEQRDDGQARDRDRRRDHVDRLGADDADHRDRHASPLGFMAR
jgi:hypothetical protein